ncbi:unnamed protein product [Ranitomeya imitator]|uniref:Uncharacterized protein n=1 Tax=Ranitomeya imitator TaxID=111125 RepID=A0ABN9LME2_9NEOB|nr:unnamed protein product [Ranitomeya imitator]
MLDPTAITTRNSGTDSAEDLGKFYACNQGKHRVTKRGPALSYPMFTLVTQGPRHRWSLESCLCDSSPATTLRFTYDHGQVISLVVIVDVQSSEKILQSGSLQVFASLLNSQSSCTAKIAHIIAEIAKNEQLRIPCVDAGLIPPLVQLLNCKDQEILLQTGRALGNICYDSHEGRRAVDQAGGAQIVVDHLRSICALTDPANEKLMTVFCGMLMNYSNENDLLIKLKSAKSNVDIDTPTSWRVLVTWLAVVKEFLFTMEITLRSSTTVDFRGRPDSLQAQLINMGVIPTLVKLLGVHSQNTPLTEMCLVAFGNLAELESSKEQFASTNVADELVKLFKKQTEHEKKEMIFEVLAPLAENEGPPIKTKEHLG